MWHLKSKPFSVQSAALEACNARPYFGYFMEQGLGKTSLINNEYIDLLLRNFVSQMVVVVPNSMKQGWPDDAKFHGSPVPYYVWPDVPEDFKKIKGESALSINYEALTTKRGFNYVESLMKHRKTLLTIDESICMKNPQAQRTRALFSLKPVAPFRRLLSGKPLTQGPHDLWAQLTMLESFPGFRYYPFKFTYCQMGGFMGKQVVGAKNEEKLNQIINGVAFRALKKNWLDLPEKVYGHRNIEMTPAQKKAYREVYEDFHTVVAGEQVTASIVLTQLLRLQQITSNFVTLDDRTVQTIGPVNPKADVTEELVEEAIGKIVIFTVFNYSTDLLIDKFKGCSFIRGGMRPAEISANKERFNKDPGCCVIVCQVQSGKYGHTLLGDVAADPDNRELRCATTIYYENTYSLDDRGQSEDRTHRIGQTLSTLYLDLICSPTDVAAITALQRKEDVARAVVDGILLKRKIKLEK